MTSRLACWYLRAVDRQEEPVRAEPARGPQRHRGVDAELARLVARGADDAPLVRTAAADDDRLAAQLRAVALLDRGEERVEVDVQDRPGRALTRGILARHLLARDRCRNRPARAGRAASEALALGLDDDRDLGRHAREDLDRDLVRAERLDRLARGRSCGGRR